MTPRATRFAILTLMTAFSPRARAKSHRIDGTAEDKRLDLDRAIGDRRNYRATIPRTVVPSRWRPPQAAGLKDVDARTVRAEPFADFALGAGSGVWVSGVTSGAVRYDGESGAITARPSWSPREAAQVRRHPQLKFLSPVAYPNFCCASTRHRKRACPGEVARQPVDGGRSRNRRRHRLRPSRRRRTAHRGRRWRPRRRRDSRAGRRGRGPRRVRPAVGPDITPHGGALLLEVEDMEDHRCRSQPTVPRRRVRRSLGDEPGRRVGHADRRRYGQSPSAADHRRAHPRRRPHRRRRCGVAAHGLAGRLRWPLPAGAPFPRPPADHACDGVASAALQRRRYAQ